MDHSQFVSHHDCAHVVPFGKVKHPLMPSPTTRHFSVAPTDEAFANLPRGTVELLALPENLDLLADILLYHVVIFREILSSQLSDGDQITTMLGQNVAISVGSTTFVNEARIVAPDILTLNGVIHGIDAVLVPPGLELPEVLFDIVETATDAGFDVLVGAVTSVGLADALKAEEPSKTVFAPTDSAFASLPLPILDYLLSDEGSSSLAEVLLYHVVGEELFSGDFVNGTEIGTLFDETVRVTVEGDGSIVVDESNVILADVKASNGVIHIVDGK